MSNVATKDEVVNATTALDWLGLPLTRAKRFGGVRQMLEQLYLKPQFTLNKPGRGGFTYLYSRNEVLQAVPSAKTFLKNMNKETLDLHRQQIKHARACKKPVQMAAVDPDGPFARIATLEERLDQVMVRLETLTGWAESQAAVAILARP